MADSRQTSPRRQVVAAIGWVLPDAHGQAVHDGESILHGTLLLAQSSSSWRAAGDGGLNPNGQAAVNKFCVGTTVVVSLHGNFSLLVGPTQQRVYA